MRNTVTTSLVLRASGGSAQTVPSSRYVHIQNSILLLHTIFAVCSVYIQYIYNVLFACNIWMTYYICLKVHCV